MRRTAQVAPSGPKDDGRRFFNVAPSAWLSERNAGAQFESCTGSRGLCVRAEASRQPWWPFVDCARRRQLSYCEGGECHGPVRPSRAVLRLCGTENGQLGPCRNLSIATLRAAAAHGLV